MENAREIAEKIAEETAMYCGQSCLHVRADGTYMMEATAGHCHEGRYLHEKPLGSRMYGMSDDEEGWIETWNEEREALVEAIVEFLEAVGE